MNGSILHCGSGPDTFKYGRYFPNATRYRCLNQWGGLGGGRFPNVDIHADIQHMPEVPSNSEDYIIATFFLFQCENIHAGMTELKRVLKTEGTIVMTFTNPKWTGWEINAPSKTRKWHKWTYAQAIELAEIYFSVIHSVEGDIGTFVVAKNDK